MMGRVTTACIAVVGAVSVGALAVGGCGSDDSNADPVASDAGSASASESASSAIDEAERTFDAAVGSTYVVAFEFIGSASVDAGAVRVAVVDGEVSEAIYPEPVLASILPRIPLLTVADMFDRARITLEQGGLVEITFDESYGHPTMLTIDPVPDAIDDEYSVRVISVDPGDLPEGDGY